MKHKSVYFFPEQVYIHTKKKHYSMIKLSPRGFFFCLTYNLTFLYQHSQQSETEIIQAVYPIYKIFTVKRLGIFTTPQMGGSNINQFLYSLLCLLKIFGTSLINSPSSAFINDGLCEEYNTP